MYLSPPHMCGKEFEFVRDAFETNWIAPLGPHVDEFEREFAQVISGADDGRRTMDAERGPSCGPLYATALSSGTAALHLALRILTADVGRKPGLRGRRTKDEGRSNEVICSTFTFSASANAIVYEGLVPVFIDCDAGSWNMDPGLLREELAACATRGKLPRAVIVVDLYGQCADYDPILAACAEYGVPVIEDAAEALGAAYWGTDEPRSQKLDARSKKFKTKNDEQGTKNARMAGSFGAAAAFSFNGNKIITTAGGGMLVSHDKAITDKARFLATQARDKAPYYQHSEIGFNYRMSNVLAAIGRGQLTVLQERIAARRRNFEFYRRALCDLPGIEFMPEAPYGRCTRWLTCLTVEGDKAKARVRAKTKRNSTSTLTSILIRGLEAENIEARPLWKPMHLQPVFRGCRVRGGAVSERLFENGLCLPSGSALTEEDLDRVCAAFTRAVATNRQ
jgi:dTDP-4-amino-4,6-dideoxygalactose transaminase